MKLERGKILGDVQADFGTAKQEIFSVENI
jgi:hypothetical protein